MQQKLIRHPWPVWTRWLSFGMLILIVCFVFGNSLTPAQQSSQVSGGVLKVLYTEAPSLRKWLTEHILRKMGHFTEYTFMGITLMMCLRSCTPYLKKNLTKPLLAGVLLALTDETIQLFVEGRSGQVSDVWLDSAGVCFGLLLAGCCIVLAEHFITRRHRKIGGKP